ncbi:protein cornichon homolog 4-like isoform X2 [Dendrobium catenatum]|uniref:Protein cornichon like 4 n=1 Tax=Dendrobium catenatum TaxID=906689 RepID=A0A2I0WI72_9ASPA|nr:protein cornichon homolog 4-like isoform X1 [Dendrobium catenatum]XP_020706039.1 protein cornichon homolog 4-like isoform X2 [Dendrobium catenatum]PKU75328.1 Protein cornichon like 4 [Dendrobium catenatum]
MVGAVIAWLFGFFMLIGLLLLVIYQLVSLSDLEYDYINPYDLSSRINAVILPEFVLQGTLCLLFLVSGQWMLFLFSAPMLYYNVRLYLQRKHLMDVTEIFNQLNGEKMRRLVKLIYLVILLFISLFWMVWTLLEDD